MFQSNWMVHELTRLRQAELREAAERERLVQEAAKGNAGHPSLLKRLAASLGRAEDKRETYPGQGELAAAATASEG